MIMLKGLLATALLLSLSLAHAGVIVGGTRVIYPEGKKETALSVTNPDKHSYLIQSWVDADEASGKKAPFIITPPLFRLGADEENSLRIIYTSSGLPDDRESMYWMNIKTIPATPEQENTNTLQIAIKTRIKLIYRPKGLTESPESAAQQLSWQRNGQTLNVTNSSPYYMNFSIVKIGASMVKDATYVAPKSSAHFTIPAGATGDVSWALISDYGSTGSEHRSHL
ncbi:fimbrial biogenesis chaperone [Pseudocitrobacter corydidari]